MPDGGPLFDVNFLPFMLGQLGEMQHYALGKVGEGLGEAIESSEVGEAEI